MQNGGEGLSSITFAGQCILVKMLITLEPHGIFYPNLQTNTLYHYRDTDMQNGIRLCQCFLSQSLATVLHTCEIY